VLYRPVISKLNKATQEDEGDHMENIEIVKEITTAFAENRHDQAILKKYFAPDFEHIANGQSTDLHGYGERLTTYMTNYKGFKIPTWDELFSTDDKVIASYSIEAERNDGAQEKIVVMAIWRLRDEKVIALREEART
jgi:limonene-1,2-epoxide hydrolase